MIQVLQDIWSGISLIVSFIGDTIKNLDHMIYTLAFITEYGTTWFASFPSILMTIGMTVIGFQIFFRIVGR